MVKRKRNKWLNAAIPALLLHCSIGTVYCWSLLSGAITEYIGAKKSVVEWAFSLAIFFLGMSAAFLGNIVERDIHKSSLIATICFTIGMAGTGFFISQKSVIGIFITYGVIMGIGLGTGYLSPVKALMLWFSSHKGLATGIAVTGFGLAKVIASPIIEWLLPKVGVVNLFYILAAVYCVCMFVGHLLLEKPSDWVEEDHHSQAEGNVWHFFQNKTFIGIWLMFYINIACGLALISQEKGIIKALGLAGAVGLISSCSAIFNSVGRFGFSTWGDTLKDRNTVYKVILGLAIIFTGITIVTGGITHQLVWIVIPLIFIVNAGYGGGFSNVPTLLSDHFGMDQISQIHGLVLSAWAVAGLTGNQIATFIVHSVGEWTTDAVGNSVNPVGYQSVLYVTGAMYIIAFIISFVLIGKPKKKSE